MSKLEIITFLVLIVLDSIFLVCAIIYDSLILSIISFILSIKLAIDAKRFPMRTPKKYRSRQ